MNKILFSLFIMSQSVLAMAQTDTTGGGMSQALVPIRIVAAKHEFYENNMRGALTIYREILEADPNNTTVLYGIAQCHYNLKKYGLALEYVEKVQRLGGEVDPMFIGKCYHRRGELDKAITYYEKVKEKGDKIDREDAAYYINQCKFAKEQMASPVNVQIKNMGQEVNTRFEEYTPSITADGNTLYFTSRRSDTKGGQIDENGDYKYFEDIYVAVKDPETGEWLDSESLPGEVNTEAYDAILSVYPDGAGLFVYRNKGESAGDIFYSDKNAADGSFKAAEKMPRPINSSYYEGSVSVTEDGNTLYFISERPEGKGNGDIYVSYKKAGKWSSPKNLGEVINTPMDEKFVFIHPNGKTLYFASNGHQCLGSYDIFRSDFTNGQWSTPVNLGYPINTVNEESTFSLTRDNKTLYIAAEYADNFGERDIYSVDVSNYNLISGGYDHSVTGQILCIVTNASGSPVKNVKVDVYGEGSELTVTSTETDKVGYARINLPGNRKYKIVLTKDGQSQTKVVDLTLKSEGETVVKVEVTF